ncbi:hypothetical protein BZA77DRAFT_343798 [Pyronema omphalodes]|nr:hypothetical protein BZA77DRAFT_343798 [Pyronema omphalodes]
MSRYSTFDMLSSSPPKAFNNSQYGDSYSSDDDSHSYDLLPLSTTPDVGFDHVELQEKILGRGHLEKILKDPIHLSNFADFLGANSPSGLRTLVLYLDSLKAIKALAYANAIASGLDEGITIQIGSCDLVKRKDEAFEDLLEELTGYVTNKMVQVVSHNVANRITGDLRSELMDAVDGLGESFCLTDPRREGNPIIFMSEEFNRVTQYGVSYAIGRNCRFLQGPATDQKTVRRLRLAIEGQKETSELFLNYRRDGSPFFNLLMVAPLIDSQGQLRYFIGAQVDVTNLLKDMIGLSSAEDQLVDNEVEHDEFQELAELFNDMEINTSKKYGGRLHSGRKVVQRGGIRRERSPSTISQRPRVLVKAGTPPYDPATFPPSPSAGLAGSPEFASLKGVYKNWLLVRPYPSLRILFTSPSLRTPGIHQLPFLSKIGGSTRVRDEVHEALQNGTSVTAKVVWLTNRDQSEGRERWIHCTPLQDAHGEVGVWMVIVVDPINQRRRREASVYMPAPIPATIPATISEHDEERKYACAPFLSADRMPPTPQHSSPPTTPAMKPKMPVMPVTPNTPLPAIVRQEVELPDFSPTSSNSSMPSPFRLSSRIPRKTSRLTTGSKDKCDVDTFARDLGLLAGN